MAIAAPLSAASALFISPPRKRWEVGSALLQPAGATSSRNLQLFARSKWREMSPSGLAMVVDLSHRLRGGLMNCASFGRSSRRRAVYGKHDGLSERLSGSRSLTPTLELATHPRPPSDRFSPRCSRDLACGKVIARTQVLCSQTYTYNCFGLFYVQRNVV